MEAAHAAIKALNGTSLAPGTKLEVSTLPLLPAATVSAVIKCSQIYICLMGSQLFCGAPAHILVSRLQVRSADNDVDTNPANDNLFVTGVPIQWTETELRNVFMPFGKILSMRLLPEMRQAMGKGEAADSMKLQEHSVLLVDCAAHDCTWRRSHVQGCLGS